MNELSPFKAIVLGIYDWVTCPIHPGGKLLFFVHPGPGKCTSLKMASAHKKFQFDQNLRFIKKLPTNSSNSHTFSVLQFPPTLS